VLDIGGGNTLNDGRCRKQPAIYFVVVVLDTDTGMRLASKVQRYLATSTTAQTAHDGAAWGGGGDGGEGLRQGWLGVPSLPLTEGSGCGRRALFSPT
jgi:hypothetical protein